MRQHIDAMGGLVQWSRVESIALCGTVEREDQTVDIVIVKKRPNKIRATVTVPIPEREDEYMQLIRAHDGKRAWTATRLAGAQETVKSEITGREAEDLLADAGVLPKLFRLWRANQPLELVGFGDFEGRAAYIIDVHQQSTATRQRFYLDRENLRTIGHQVSSGETTVLNRYSEYQEHNGVFLPTRTEILDPETGLSILRTESIQIGVGIYSEYFSQVP